LYTKTYIDGDNTKAMIEMFEDILSIEETKVTVRKYRHRTTVPTKIFKLLDLKDGDTIRWIAMKNGKIFIEKIEKTKTL
jgi:bifunctional DNA-binding transcriptional regulator/antitoxin component of YhaV-PrlF toxin-antitoxin module